MKIVINTCFGGFSVSTELMKRLVIEGSRVVYSVPESEFSQFDTTKSQREDVGDGFEVEPYTRDCVHKDGMVYYMEHHHHEDRADPVLVRLVEEMGSEAASGSFSRLRVVTLPDWTPPIKWTITEYDGHEQVEEVHRVWK